MARHRKKKHKAIEAAPPVESKKEEELEIDLSKLKSIFSSKNKDGSEQKKEDDVVEFDLSGIYSALSSHKRLLVFSILIAIFLFSLWVRLLPGTSGILHEYDSFFWYRYAKLFVTNGLHFPDFDPYSYYPPGRDFETATWFPATLGLFYLLFKAFIPSMTIMQTTLIVPPLIGALTIFPTYFIGKKVSSEYAGLLSAFLVGASPAILGRTIAGFSDTDSIVIFYTLVVVMIYLYMIESIKDGKITKSSIVYLICTILAYVTFANNWNAANYITYVIFVFPFVLLAFYFIFSDGKLLPRAVSASRKAKSFFVLTITFLLSSYLLAPVFQIGPKRAVGQFFASIWNLVNTFLSYSHIVSGLKGQGAGVGDYNVFISVAELQAPSWGSYPAQLGYSIYLALLMFTLGTALIAFRFIKREKAELVGYIVSVLFLVAAIITYLSKILVAPLLVKLLLGMATFFFLTTLANKQEYLIRTSQVFFEDERHARGMLFVLMWGSMIFAISTLGLRFIMVLSPAICVASGIFLDKLIRAVGVFSKKLSPLIFTIVLLFLLLSYAPIAVAIGRGSGSSVTQDWHESLTWIKENTPHDTTTISWWDPGHWVTAMTQRYSGADGAHYMGGPRPINKRIDDFGYMFTTTSEAESLERMSYYIGNLSEMYLISSADLLGKFTWLSFFSTGQSQNYLFLNKAGEQKVENTTYYVYPANEQLAIVVGKEDSGLLRPYVFEGDYRQPIREIAYPSGNQIVRIDLQEGLDGMVWVQPDMSSAIFMPGTLKDNILTRTFLFQGQGLEHFELVHQTPSIKLYRIHFD
ncbi:MAG: STT3 domain-containing protein [archaeon]